MKMIKIQTRFVLAAMLIALVLSIALFNTAGADADDASNRLIVDGASCVWSSSLNNADIESSTDGVQADSGSSRIVADSVSCLWTTSLYRTDAVATISASLAARITTEYADTMYYTALYRPSSLPAPSPSTPATPAPPPVTPSPEPSEEPEIAPQTSPEPEQPEETPGVTPQPSESQPAEEEMISVYLYGHKTDVTVGEDILLDLSAINLITRPQMTVQLILKVPSGMSVTSSGFIFGGGGQYTSTFTVEPGEAKLIEVHIIANQAGNFNVVGDICYYFGGNVSTASYESTTLPVKVSAAQQSAPVYVPPVNDTQPSGFQMEPWVIPAAVIGGLFVILLIVLAVRMKS